MTTTETRRSDELRAMVAMAREHGFAAWPGPGCVFVEVDWVHAQTGETGADVERATTYLEMRAILGY